MKIQSEPPDGTTSFEEEFGYLMRNPRTRIVVVTAAELKNQKAMTQKGNLFKGKQKCKTIPPNRHGKAPVTRKGKRFVKPSKVSKEMEADRELSKFINQCNELKAANIANKEGGQLSIVKTPKEPNANANVKK